MDDNSFYEHLKKELIPKLLSAIEAHGVDMMHAEQIPMFLDKAIKHSNFDQKCVTTFKPSPWED